MAATPDLAALARIRSLELRARSIMEGLWRGLHRSPFHGFSVEFSEYRAYVQGDDPRHLDWKVMARSDRCFIKKFEDETNLRCQLVVDHSRSMHFGGPLTKAGYSATLAATLAMFLMQQGDAVGVTTFGEGLQGHIPPRNRPGHLRRLMHELEKPAPAGGSSLDLSIRQLADLLPRRGMICLASDLLAPVEKLEQQLGLLGAMGHDVVLFHVMDRSEIDFTFEKGGFFRDAETGMERFIDPSTARGPYLERLADHGRRVRAACERQGIEYLWTPTDTPIEKVLFDFLSRRRTRTPAAGRPRTAN